MEWITVSDRAGTTVEDKSSGQATRQDIPQMKAMLTRARRAVPWNDSGWQMAYQRSTDMALNVNTDTEIQSVWNRTKWRLTNLVVVCVKVHVWKYFLEHWPT